MKTAKVKDLIAEYLEKHHKFAHSKDIAEYYGLDHQIIIDVIKLMTDEDEAGSQEILEIQRFGRTVYLREKGREIRRTSSFLKQERKWYTSLDNWLKIAAILVALAIGLAKLYLE
jgi:hypothetical protein